MLLWGKAKKKIFNLSGSKNSILFPHSPIYRNRKIDWQPLVLRHLLLFSCMIVFIYRRVEELFWRWLCLITSLLFKKIILRFFSQHWGRPSKHCWEQFSSPTVNTVCPVVVWPQNRDFFFSCSGTGRQRGKGETDSVGHSQSRNAVLCFWEEKEGRKVGWGTLVERQHPFPSSHSHEPPPFSSSSCPPVWPLCLSL